MQWLAIGAVACAAVVGGCDRQKPANPAFSQLDDGLRYKHVRFVGGHTGALISAHIIAFDPRRWQQHVVGPREVTEATDDPETFRRAGAAVAAINAGFFDPQLRPLGLLVSGGKQRSRLRKVDHGVLTIDTAGVPRLQHARSFVRPPNLDFAIECGPRLVVAGKPLTFKPGIARRTAIGFDDDRQLYWIATENVASLKDLAGFLAAEQQDGGLGLSNALNLDGGKSTMLRLTAAETSVHIRASVQVPVGLALARRPQVE